MSLREQLQNSLGDAYQLDRELGGGGMADVSLARDTRLDRAVVINVLSPELAAGRFAERFARKIKLTAQLQEPHIVPVLSDGVTGEGFPYYTMAFVMGASLRQRLVEGTVPVSEDVGIRFAPGIGALPKRARSATYR